MHSYIHTFHKYKQLNFYRSRSFIHKYIHTYIHTYTPGWKTSKPCVRVCIHGCKKMVCMYVLYVCMYVGVCGSLTPLRHSDPRDLDQYIPLSSTKAARMLSWFEYTRPKHTPCYVCMYVYVCILEWVGSIRVLVCMYVYMYVCIQQ